MYNVHDANMLTALQHTTNSQQATHNYMNDDQTPTRTSTRHHRD